MNIELLKAMLVLNRCTPTRTRPLSDRLINGDHPCEVLQDFIAGLTGKASEKFTSLNKTFDPEKEIEDCLKQNIQLLSIQDSAYPAMLRKISDPPLLLYVKGNLSRADDSALAIVGSRHATLYGSQQAHCFGRQMAEYGWTIVSGLARGIDQGAHEGALQSQHGRTIAVLGCGVDQVYPRENRRLYEMIQERGAVVSEFSLGAKPLAHHFPRRNRIISGWSLATLVVEAHLRSGSLITAREALEQGREVFAIPGRIDQPTSRGTHQLIREGAGLIDAPTALQDELSDCLYRMQDVLTERRASPEHPLLDFSIEKPEEKLQRPAAVDTDEYILVDALQKGSLSYDEILSQKLITGDRLNDLLLSLEIEQKITKNAKGRFELKIH